MKVDVEKQQNSQIQLKVMVPIEDVKATYDQVVDTAVENLEIQGFRKGKAPRNVVEEKVGTSKLFGDTVNKLLQKYYTQAVKENHINPLSNPKVEIKEFSLDKDFEFTATVAVKPDITMGDYKPELKKKFEEKYNSAKKELENTNKEKLAKGEKLEEPHVHLSVGEVLDVLDKFASLETPDLLVEEEVDRMMARLVDQTQSLGMTTEQYLKAQNKTADGLRDEYRAVSRKNIRAELILGHLIREEKIEIPDEEIDETFMSSGMEDAQSRMKDPMDRMYVKSVLQKNHLLAKLMEEAEGEHSHEHK